VNERGQFVRQRLAVSEVEGFVEPSRSIAVGHRQEVGPERMNAGG